MLYGKLRAIRIVVIRQFSHETRKNIGTLADLDRPRIGRSTLT